MCRIVPYAFCHNRFHAAASVTSKGLSLALTLKTRVKAFQEMEHSSLFRSSRKEGDMLLLLRLLLHSLLLTVSTISGHLKCPEVRSKESN